MNDKRNHTPDGGALRPCEVDGRACHFHRFVEEERGVLIMSGFWPTEAVKKIREAFEKDGVAACGCEVEKLRHAYALVEFPDGSLRKVEPESVRFTDGTQRAGAVWVNVTDALPEPLEDVLVVYANGMVISNWLRHDNEFAYSFSQHGAVTHWMKIPTPPGGVGR